MVLTRRLHPLSCVAEHRLIHAHGHLWLPRPLRASSMHLHDHIQPLIAHGFVPDCSRSPLGQRIAEELVRVKSP